MAKRKKLVTGVFSKNELKILKKMYSSTGTKEVAAKLGRKVKSVEVKASKLGLKKTKKYLKSVGLAK
jgi:hypothetical protein